MADKSDGKTAIETLQGMTLREHVISIVEALPLTRKTPGSPHGNITRNHRSVSRDHRYF
jgi:hypothetical protein